MDISIVRNVIGDEMMVCGVDGETDLGLDFVDAWTGHGYEYTVVDYGQIVIPLAALPTLTEVATKVGLVVE